ncbi:DHA2 family efflux MFS transporter permease subunit [Clostridium saccharoperbutylacetonicum]
MKKKNVSTSSKWSMLFVLVIGSFMSALDSSIVNIAIPKIMSVFGASLDDVKWVLTAYTLTLGAIVPVTGYLSDVVGTKKMFIFAIATFTIGSFLCGISWSNGTMIFFRIIQAIGGGMIMPISMTMMMQRIPKNERGTAIGIWGIAALSAPAIGPTLGGYIIEKLDWRIIFYINVPIGILGTLLAIILLENDETNVASKFDYIGLITSTLAIVSLLYVLGEGTNLNFEDIKNPILIIISLFCFILFIINELSIENPLMELRVLNNFTFTISQIIQSILMFAFMGGMYVMPLFLENIRGYSAMETGEILFIPAIAQAFVMPISGKLFDKIGAKIPCVIGLCLLILSSYKLAFINIDTSKFYIQLVMIIRGIGLGLSFMPITTAGLNAVSYKLAGQASSINNTIKQIAGSLGVTIMTNMIQGKCDLNYARLSEQVTSFNTTTSSIISQLQALYMQNGYSQGDSNNVVTYTITQLIYRQSYIEGIEYALVGAAVAAVIALILVFLITDKKKYKAEPALQE